MSSYAKVSPDLQLFTPAQGSLAGVNTADQQAMLDATSTEVDGYLKPRFTLPLQEPYPADLRMHICRVAYYRLLAGKRGLNPRAGGSDEVWQKFHDESLAWFKGIPSGKVTPAEIIDSSSDSDTGGGADAEIVTSPERGYTPRPR